MTFTKPFLLATLIVTLSGCASPATDNENGCKRVIVNTRLVVLLGATAGALTGTANLAVKECSVRRCDWWCCGFYEDTDDARNAQRTQSDGRRFSQDNRTDAEKRVASGSGN